MRAPTIRSRIGAGVVIALTASGCGFIAQLEDYRAAKTSGDGGKGRDLTTDGSVVFSLDAGLEDDASPRVEEPSSIVDSGPSTAPDAAPANAPTSFCTGAGTHTLCEDFDTGNTLDLLRWKPTVFGGSMRIASAVSASPPNSLELILLPASVSSPTGPIIDFLRPSSPTATARVRFDFLLGTTWAGEEGSIDLFVLIANDDGGGCGRALLAVDKDGFYVSPCPDCADIPLGSAKPALGSWASLDMSVTFGAGGGGGRVTGSLLTDQQRSFDLSSGFSVAGRPATSATFRIGAGSFGRTPRATVNVDNILLDLAP